MLVDAVSKVVDFHESDIDEAPSFNGNINTDYIEGMGKTEDGFIILLNIDNLLSMEDIDQFDKISTETVNEEEVDWEDANNLQAVAQRLSEDNDE